MVKTDQKRMQQVLLNLLSNAVKFSETRGLIVIRVAKVLLDDIQEKSYIKISVNDHGLGIKKKDS